MRAGREMSEKVRMKEEQWMATNMGEAERSGKRLEKKSRWLLVREPQEGRRVSWWGKMVKMVKMVKMYGGVREYSSDGGRAGKRIR
jgi:fructose-1,6-bisphosphatase